jgi:pyruvate ferredoxin oxidoreductase beta subunit
MAVNLKALPEEELIGAGRSGCAGCAAMLVPRIALKALGAQMILISATGCVISNYTHAGSPQVPFMHSLLPGAASLIAGIDSGLIALGKREGITLMAIAGDGGTADIGLQALSGAAERGHRFLYVCYDNEGYMNTGGQRSGTTPFDANTSTTPADQAEGIAWIDLTKKKDMPLIMAAHGIPYVATASVAYPQDFLRKVTAAAAVDGQAPSRRYPATTDGVRRRPVDQGVEAAVQTHVALFEIENGHKYTLQLKDQLQRPVADYLKLQSRFRHLSDGQIALIQAQVDERWEYLRRLAGANA